MKLTEAVIKNNYHIWIHKSTFPLKKNLRISIDKMLLIVRLFDVRRTEDIKFHCNIIIWYVT